jgi:alkylation response protein AidB-like acyl-CoA dehydrogenase
MDFCRAKAKHIVAVGLFALLCALSPLAFAETNHEFESCIIEQIEATVHDLRGTKDFLSPTAWRKKTAPFGLPGLDLPPDVGGKGYTAAQMAQVFEYMGKVSLDMRDMVGGGHVRPLLQSETPEVRAIVEDVAKGEAYIAVAITEKEAGSNMRAMTSVSEKTAGGYLLTGAKMYNARFETATHVIVFARSPVQDSATTKLNAFILPKDYPGLQYQQLSAHGLLGNSFGGVSFDHIFVPDQFRIGGEGEGGKIFRDHFLYWRLMQASAAIGTGKGALEQAVQRLRTRQAFGGPIGRFTHFQQELAEHTAKLHMASLLVRQAADLIDEGKSKDAIALVAMAKAEGVDWALEASDFAMELFGAEGYSPDLTDLGQRVRDLQGLRVADGTTHIMRQEVVRQIYGADLWDMAVGNTGIASALGTPIPARIEDLPSGAFTRLRNELVKQPHALAKEEDYDEMIKPGGGGACPTVAAANLLQGLGVMSGKSPVLNLDQVIRAAYGADPSLLNGRLTNEQVVKLLGFYQKTFLPDVKFKSQVDYQRALQPGSQPEKSRGWSDLDSALLQPRAREMKLISYTVKNSRGKLIGRHFVVLKERVGDTLVVEDAANPTKDFTYKLKRVDLPKKGGSSFQLVRPGTPKKGAMTLMVNTVFTVTLRDGS